MHGENMKLIQGVSKVLVFTQMSKPTTCFGLF